MLLNISDSPSTVSRLQPQGPTWKEKLTKVKAAGETILQPQGQESSELLAWGRLMGYPLLPSSPPKVKTSGGRAGTAVGVAHRVLSNTLRVGQPHCLPCLVSLPLMGQDLERRKKLISKRGMNFRINCKGYHLFLVFHQSMV